MKARLQLLYALQLIDKQLDELAENRGDLPDVIAQMERHVANDKKDQKELEKTAKESIVRRDEIELEASELKARIEKWKKQQFQVKTNKQYDALSREIETAQKKLKDLDKELQIVEGKAQVAREDAKKLVTVIDEREDELKERTKELNAINKEHEQEELGLQHQRDKLVVRIQKADLREYERIRKAKEGIAVVSVRREACSSCYNRVPPQLILELRKNDRIIKCEHCGVILVSDEIVAHAASEA